MVHRALLLLVGLAAAITLSAGCSADNGAAGTGRPTIVVTHAILGAVVTDLAGHAADVSVLMPDGIDPHDFQPSAKDIERLQTADLVVANGLGLEASLDDALRQAKNDGRAVFTAGDHVRVRTVDGAPDPHFWTDPTQMASVVASLSAAARDTLGLDLATSATAADRRLLALDGELKRTLDRIPRAERRLVTGHESMGYFARRYGFTLVGAVVPGLSSQARVSASALGDLKATIAKEGVAVVFAEAGTARQVVDAIADETGARVIEIPSHTLPDDGSYEGLVRETARRISQALG